MTMKCQQCGREITSDICPHCGGKAEPFKVKVGGTIGLKGVTGWSSEVTVEKEGMTRTTGFTSKATSNEIVSTTLPLDWIDPKGELVDFQKIKGTVAQNIELMEELAKQPRSSKVTDEHSFELNFGLFKYKFKRKTEKD
jgi:hypothetical protein